MFQSGPLVTILVFLCSAAVVIVASTILARRTDAIADATGIGQVTGQRSDGDRVRAGVLIVYSRVR